jgi:uncharacterized membrane protein
MKTGLIIVATFLLIIGLIGLVLRLFFSMSIQDLGFANIDVVCIFIPVICIIFGIILFILGLKGTDSNITQVTVTQKNDTKDDAMKTLDTRFANEEIAKEQYKEIKEEIKK